MELKEYCTKYIAFLRALYLIHQNHHWIVSGSSFYGNHLLFERIYKSAAENADLAAEKLIGLFGVEILNIEKQPSLIAEVMEKYSTSNVGDIDLVKNSLQAEQDFLTLADEFYAEFKKQGIPLGTDDAIMSISNERDSAVYLLQQILRGKKEAKLNALADKFSMKLALIMPSGTFKPILQLNQASKKAESTSKFLEWIIAWGGRDDVLGLCKQVASTPSKTIEQEKQNNRRIDAIIGAIKWEMNQLLTEILAEK